MEDSTTYRSVASLGTNPVPGIWPGFLDILKHSFVDLRHVIRSTLILIDLPFTLVESIPVSSPLCLDLSPDDRQILHLLPNYTLEMADTVPLSRYQQNMQIIRRLNKLGINYNGATTRFIGDQDRLRKQQEIMVMMEIYCCTVPGMSSIHTLTETPKCDKPGTLGFSTSSASDDFFQVMTLIMQNLQKISTRYNNGQVADEVVPVLGTVAINAIQLCKSLGGFDWNQMIPNDEWVTLMKGHINCMLSNTSPDNIAMVERDIWSLFWFVYVYKCLLPIKYFANQSFSKGFGFTASSLYLSTNILNHVFVTRHLTVSPNQTVDQLSVNRVILGAERSFQVYSLMQLFFAMVEKNECKVKSLQFVDKASTDAIWTASNFRRLFPKFAQFLRFVRNHELAEAMDLQIGSAVYPGNCKEPQQIFQYIDLVSKCEYYPMVNANMALNYTECIHAQRSPIESSGTTTCILLPSFLNMINHSKSRGAKPEFPFKYSKIPWEYLLVFESRLSAIVNILQESGINNNGILPPEIAMDFYMEDNSIIISILEGFKSTGLFEFLLATCYNTPEAVLKRKEISEPNIMAKRIKHAEKSHGNILYNPQ
jgi:hypothetical protein